MLGLEDVIWQTVGRCHRKIHFFRLLIVLAALANVKCLEKSSQLCIPMETLYHVTLSGGIAAGDYMKLGKVDSHSACSKFCCQDTQCDVAFMANDMCYNLHCYSSKLCHTHPAKESRFNVSVTYVKRGFSDAVMTTIFDRVDHNKSASTNVTSQNNSSVDSENGATSVQMVNQSNTSMNESQNVLDGSRKVSSPSNGSSVVIGEQNVATTARNNNVVMSNSSVVSGEKNVATTTRNNNVVMSNSSVSSLGNAASSESEVGQNQTKNDEHDKAHPTGSLAMQNLSLNGIEQQKVEVLKDKDNHPPLSNHTYDSQWTQGYGNASKRTNKLMVYWKNESNIIVKEIVDDRNSTHDQPTQDGFNMSSHFSTNNSQRLPGEDVTNTNKLLPVLNTTTVPASNAKGNDSMSANVAEGVIEIVNPSSGHSSQESSTSVESNIDSLSGSGDFPETILDHQNYLNKENTSSNNDNAIILEKNNTRDFVTMAGKEKLEKELLEKSFYHSNSSLVGERGNEPPLNDTDFSLKYANIRHGLKGKSFNSKEHGTLLDLSSPSAHLSSNISAVITSNSSSNYESSLQLGNSSSLLDNTTSVKTNSSSVLNLSIEQKVDEKLCFSNEILHNRTLKAGLAAGEFTDYGVVKDMKACADYCCTDQACNLALMLGFTCYTLRCKTPADCQVMAAHPSHLNPRISFVTRIKLPSVATARDRDKSKLLPSVTPRKMVSKRVKGSRCQHGSIQSDVTLKSGQKAGIFKVQPRAKDMDSCLESCCKDKSCNVAFLIDKSCYSVRCNSHDDCAIIKRGKSSRVHSSLSVVRSKIMPMNDKRQQIPKTEKKYTTVLNITNQVFSPPLADFESLEFLNFGVKIQTAISMILAAFNGYKESEVISFKPSPLMTKVELRVLDDTQIKKILISLVKTVKAGKMVSSIDGVDETFELSTSGFQFDTPKGFNMVCDSEFDYDVHWKLTVFDYQSVSPCPRKANGEARRSCHGSENHNATWGFPSFADCVSSEYKTLQSKAKSFAEGAKKKIPFKILQSKLQTTPSDILIKIQKLTFEDTYRAMLDMSRKPKNTSLGHAKMGDSKQSPSTHPKPPKKPKTLFSNDTFSIPLPDPLPKDAQNQTAHTFSRANIPKPAKIAPVKTSAQKPLSHPNVAKNPNVLEQHKSLPSSIQNKPGNTRTAQNQMSSRNSLTSTLKHQPNSLAGAMKPKYGVNPISASQTSISSSSSYPNIRYPNNQVAQKPQSPYGRYQQQLRIQKLQASQARQKLLQNAALRNQANQRNQGLQNRQSWQQNWQNNQRWTGNQFGGQTGQAGYNGYGGIPGYGMAGFQGRSSKFQEKVLTRKKRDLEPELVRVKRQGGNAVWYNGYNMRGSTPRSDVYRASPDENSNYREPVLTDVRTGYDNPEDKLQDYSPYNENYFHGPTPLLQTATYRLGGSVKPTQGVTGSSSQSQPFANYPTNSVTGFGNTQKGMSSKIEPIKNGQGGFTTSTPGQASESSDRFGTIGTIPNIQYLLTTIKPYVGQTGAGEVPAHHQGLGSVMTTASPLTSTSSDKSTAKNLHTNTHPTVTKGTVHPTSKSAVLDLLKKKLLDLTHSTPNKTKPETSHPMEDFSQEKNRAPMFGGDIALIVDTLRDLSLYSKYTNPPETVNTLKQFLQVGSHILDKRNKQEWKYLTKKSPKEVSALDAAEIIEDYSKMVAQKLHPKDMTKPILTTNILVALRSVDLNTVNPSKDILFPNYSNPTIGNWSDASDTLVIKPQSFLNSIKGKSVQLVSCSVRRLTDLLPKSLVSKTFGNQSVISGHVMSVSSSPSLGDNINPPIRIVLSNSNQDVSQFEEQCVFWERGFGNKPGRWSSRGCSFVESNISHTTCECSHMSTFSAIANTAKQKPTIIATVSPLPPPEPEEQSNVLYILLGVLAILMLVFVALAIICVYWKRRKKQQEGDSKTAGRQGSKKRRPKERSDDNVSTGSEEFDDMLASRRRNVHPDNKQVPTDSPRWQRLRKNGENPENLLLKEKSYLFSDYHQPYHFLSARTPQPPSSRERSKSS